MQGRPPTHALATLGLMLAIGVFPSLLAFPARAQKSGRTYNETGTVVAIRTERRNYTMVSPTDNTKAGQTIYWNEPVADVETTTEVLELHDEARGQRPLALGQAIEFREDKDRACVPEGKGNEHCYNIEGRRARPQEASTTAKTELQIGTATVWLGMTTKQAEEQFSGYPYKIIRANNARPTQGFPDAQWVVRESDSDPDALAFVDFRNGIVTFAQRTWLVGEVRGLDGAIRALHSLMQQNQYSCMLYEPETPAPSPGTAPEEVGLRCGLRLVVLMGGTFEGKPAENVQESIGPLE